MALAALPRPALQVQARAGSETTTSKCFLRPTNAQNNTYTQLRLGCPGSPDRQKSDASSGYSAYAQSSVGEGAGFSPQRGLTSRLTPQRNDASTEKNEALAKRSRREVASLLEVGKTETARIRTESLILQDTHNELSVAECALG